MKKQTGIVPVLVAVALVAAVQAADNTGTLTIGDTSHEFEVNTCQFPSGPDDPMGSMLPRMVLIGKLSDGILSRIDVRTISGQRIEFSADGQMLYEAIRRQRDGAWSSERGPEDGPLFQIEGKVLTASAMFKERATGEWVAGEFRATCQ